MKTNQRPIQHKVVISISLAIATLILFACVHSVRAQTQSWTTPNAQGHINNANSGNVGVGTTTPDKRLTVQGDLPFGGNLAVIRTTGPNNAYGLALDASGTGNNNLGFMRNGATRASFAWDNSRNFLGFINTLYSPNDFTMRLNSDGSFTYNEGVTGAERFRITAAGNVGIGTTTPAFKLDVAGEIRSSSGGFRFPDGTVQTTAAVSGGGGSSPWLLSGTSIYYNGGNVGIGTQSPGSKLDVLGTIRAGSANTNIGNLQIYGSTYSGFWREGADYSLLTDGTSTLLNAPVGSGNLYFRSGNVDRMVLHGSSGNLGIGTATPASTLQLGGNTATITLGAQATEAGPYKITVVGSSSNTPSTKGTAHGRNLVVEAGTSDDFANVTGGDLYLRPGIPRAPATQYGNVLLADQGGNVGIGTASPTAKLQVVGQIRATDSSGNGLRTFDDGTSTYFMALTSTDMGRNLTVKSQNLFFHTGTTYSEKMRIDQNGNVGIGTSSPTSKLDVAGEIRAGGGIRFADGTVQTTANQSGGGGGVTSAANISAGQFGQNTGGGNYTFSGNLTVNGTVHAKYQDLAEWVPAENVLPAGTVVILSINQSNHVTASGQAYDTRVAGVISETPGLALGEGGPGKVLVATTGRVRVKVDASRGPIAIGDLLVTSDIPGVAMKSEPLNVGGAAIHRPGTLIGKALEPLAKGKGEILVLLSLQ